MNAALDISLVVALLLSQKRAMKRVGYNCPNRLAMVFRPWWGASANLVSFQEVVRVEVAWLWVRVCFVNGNGMRCDEKASRDLVHSVGHLIPVGTTDSKTWIDLLSRAGLIKGILMTSARYTEPKFSSS